MVHINRFLKNVQRISYKNTMKIAKTKSFTSPITWFSIFFCCLRGHWFFFPPWIDLATLFLPLHVFSIWLFSFLPEIRWISSAPPHPHLSLPLGPFLCSLGILRSNPFNQKSCDKPRQHIKKQRHYFANKCLPSQSCGFSSSHVWMWELDHKESLSAEEWMLLNCGVREDSWESLGW